MPYIFDSYINFYWCDFRYATRKDSRNGRKGMGSILGSVAIIFGLELF